MTRRRRMARGWERQLKPVGSIGLFGRSFATVRYSTDVIVACRMVRRHFPPDSFRQTSVKRRRTVLPAFAAVSRGLTTSSPMITT